MKSCLTSMLALGAFCALGQAPASAGEARLSYCNDSYFNSDGGGITGCLGAAVHSDATTVALGIYGATAEQTVSGGIQPDTDDQLDALSRLVAWYAHDFEAEHIQYTLGLRAGLQGGAIDEMAIGIHDVVHEISGFASEPIESTKPLSIIGGVAGWLSGEVSLGSSSVFSGTLTPYGFGTAGNDIIEGGAGLMISLQPVSAAAAFALPLPEDGAYAPTFGGDGIALFADARVVAMETLYGDLSNPFVAEAGMAAQMTMWHRAVLGSMASCASLPYDGAPKADCRATLRLGMLF